MDYKKRVKEILSWLESYPMKQDVLDIPVVLFEDVDNSFMISRYRNKYVLKDDFVDSGLWRYLSRNPQSIIACTLTEMLEYIGAVDPDYSVTYRNILKTLLGVEYKEAKQSYLDFKAMFPDTDTLADKAEEWELADNKRVLEIYFGVTLGDDEEEPAKPTKPRHLGVVKEDDDES